LYIVDRKESNNHELRIQDAHLSLLDSGALTWWQLVNSTDYPQSAMTSWTDGALREADLLKKKSAAAAKDLESFVTVLESAESAAVIEYIDVEEQDTVLIATTPADMQTLRGRLQQWTHCEIHSCAIFSMASAIIPLLHHNNAAYNALALAQTKQAIGVYATNFANRFDVAGMVLNYPQLPFVTTRFAERLCDGKLCHGDNLVVAIATYTGYNQEDACIINMDSCMRGMFDVTCYETIKYRDEEYGSEALIAANPMHLQSKGLNVDGVKSLDYGHLDERGMPMVGTVLREGLLLVGMVHVKTVEVDAGGMARDPQTTGSKDMIGKNVIRKKVYTDRSIIADRSHEGRTVDRVYTYRDESGNGCAKIRLRHVRSPELGDKMATRFAQKGVVGMLMRREDMPYSSSGVIPDIIINPHSHPKRMTVGHMLDCLLSKVACVHGTRLQTNAFEPKDVDGLQDLLQTQYGLDRCGDEILYNGMTGCQMQCAIFTGLNYYGRLKHMVADKMNFRDAGPRNFLTRQATKGRGKHGGLRVGEMEEHAILAHGASAFLKESFMERADKHEMYVDARTGAAGTVISNDAAGVLTTMGKTAEAPSTDVRAVAVPYAFKLLQQELQGMSIDTKIRFDNDYEEDDDDDDFVIVADDDDDDRVDIDDEN
jgi:DNA-directed RNA polymerase II subunit RPB2